MATRRRNRGPERLKRATREAKRQRRNLDRGMCRECGKHAPAFGFQICDPCYQRWADAVEAMTTNEP